MMIMNVCGNYGYKQTVYGNGEDSKKIVENIIIKNVCNEIQRNFKNLKPM